MKKPSGSSRRGRRLRAKGRRMKASARALDRELTSLLRLPDNKIDTSEMLEVVDWSKAVVGKFYRPIKEPVTIRLDADIVAWLKKEGPGYQTRINALLRKVMTGKRRIA